MMKMEAILNIDVDIDIISNIVDEHVMPAFIFMCRFICTRSRTPAYICMCPRYALLTV